MISSSSSSTPPTICTLLCGHNRGAAEARNVRERKNYFLSYFYLYRLVNEIFYFVHLINKLPARRAPPDGKGGALTELVYQTCLYRLCSSSSPPPTTIYGRSRGTKNGRRP